MYRQRYQTIKDLWRTADVGLLEVHSRLSGYETCGDFRLSGDWESHDTKQMSFWVLGLMVECIRREIVASEYIFRI